MTVINDENSVLAKKKDIVPEKGKDRDIEKWEAELRKSLAAKKAAASTTLSKQDRTLVDAQLRLEAGIRKQVASVKRDLDRGLALVGDLVAAKVDEFQQYVWPIATLLLEGVLRNGAVLIGSAAVETYLVCLDVIISSNTTDRCRVAYCIVLLAAPGTNRSFHWRSNSSWF